MDLVSGTGVASGFIARPRRSAASGLHRPNSLLFPKCPCPSLHAQRSPLVARAKKKGSIVRPILDEGGRGGGEERDDDVEDFGDEILVDDDEAFEDEFEMDDAKLYVGDGGEGGGISLAGTSWDKKALSLAEKVSMSFDGDLKIYAFKTTVNSTIRVRIENLSSKYGSPSMTDIEAFSSAYQELLDEAGLAGTIPENLSLEVSSPGVERVIRIPEELERFKEKPMKVRYTINNAASDSPEESEGIYKLISFDLDSQNCTWGIADVKANRKQAGKGRPLTKKQREWRLQTPFDSLILVRIHSDC